MKLHLAVGLAAAIVTLCGCVSRRVNEDPVRLAELQRTYDELHSSFEKATAKDPMIAAAFAEHGQVLMAMRSGLIQQLATDVSRQYLDTVTLDLKSVTGKSSGEIGKDTFLGHVKIGDWKVKVQLGKLLGHLRVGAPSVELRGSNLIDVRLPVQVQETEGDARLAFSWDSAALANAICKDFELDQEIRGHIAPQGHVLSGSFRVDNVGEDLIAVPLFPERHVLVKLDLTPRSWEIVEVALRSQNHSGKCGMLLKPDRVMEFLRGLAGEGISVRLPDSIFRTVRLPGRIHQSVKVDDRRVGLVIKTESLRIQSGTLWSSASIQVQPPARP